MIVAFDASILIFVRNANANAPLDPATGKPVERCQERVEWLIETLQQANGRIVIPTPALAEVLVRAGSSGPQLLQKLGASRHFRVVAFDERAAVEFAARQAERLNSGLRLPAPTRAKAKFDDQIVSIAIVEGATTIYSDDEDIAKLAAGRIQVIRLGAMPLPAGHGQAALPFGEPSDPTPTAPRGDLEQ